MKSVAFDAHNDCTLLFISFPLVKIVLFLTDSSSIYHSNLPSCASTRSYSTLKCWVLGLELCVPSLSSLESSYRVIYFHSVQVSLGSRSNTVLRFARYRSDVGCILSSTNGRSLLGLLVWCIPRNIFATTDRLLLRDRQKSGNGPQRHRRRRRLRRTPSHVCMYVCMCPRHLRDGYELESFVNSS